MHDYSFNHRCVGERLSDVSGINRKQITIWHQTEYLVTGAYARHAPAGAGALLLIFGISGLISTIMKEPVVRVAVSMAAQCRAWPPALIGINGSNKGR